MLNPISNNTANSISYNKDEEILFANFIEALLSNNTSSQFRVIKSDSRISKNTSYIFRNFYYIIAFTKLITNYILEYIYLNTGYSISLID